MIWFDADFDWSYLGTVLEYKLNRMAKSMDHGCILNRERYARQLRECRDLVHRLNDDKYFQNAQLGYSEIGPNPNFMIRDRGYADAIHASDMHKQDQQRLGMLIGKYLSHWWW